MPTTDDLMRASHCQRQAALRMETHCSYRRRGEANNNAADIKDAIRMHRTASEFYGEARERMGLGG